LGSGERAGFLIGDGAGVGKGRTIAGIIHENFLQGRKKAIWVSVSNDLKYDAERDLKDIGADNIDVHFLSKMKYGKINSSLNNYVKKVKKKPRLKIASVLSREPYTLYFILYSYLHCFLN
jgi:hypothetical protein